jgi:tripartite ATP-independent transporter DctM subunit
MTILFCAFFVLMFAGVPVAFAVGLSTIIFALNSTDISTTILITKMVGQLELFPLLAIPFFVLAGYLMNECGVTERIVAISNLVVGDLRAGLAYVNVVASMIFAGISGSATADAAAIGGMMIPTMIRSGYGKEFTVVLSACAATIGPIIPPSIMMVLYGSLANVSIGKLFIGGFLPGVLIGLGLMIVSYFICKKRGYTANAGPRPPLREAIWILADASWALFMPVLIIGGILSGLFTATEAGVVAVFYALAVGLFVYRKLQIRELPRILFDAVIMTNVVMLVIVTSAAFAAILVGLQFEQLLTSALSMVSSNATIQFLAILGVLFILGMFVDAAPLVIIFAPTIAAFAIKNGLDPVHVGVVVVVMTMIGTVTPPVGTILYVTCTIGRVPIQATIPTLIPLVFGMLVVTVLCAIFPQIVLLLPNLFFDR